jgi:hypothetical protein
MRLSEALTNQGFRSTKGPIEEDSLEITCQTCGTKNSLAQVREQSGETTYYCVQGCPSPIASVDPSGLPSIFGKLSTATPSSDDWTFPAKETF